MLSQIFKNLKTFLIVIFVLVILVIIVLSLSKSSVLKSLIPPKIVAEVNGEKIYSPELEKANGLFATLEQKNKNDPTVREHALNFLIENRLLKKEAAKRGLLEIIETSAETLLNSSLTGHGGQQGLENNFHTDIATFKSYLLNSSLINLFKTQTTEWATIDALSIRYLFRTNPPSEDLAYKKIVDKKIQEYYSKIKNGLSVREAIKERCLDPELDYFPADRGSTSDQRPVPYSGSFDGNSCREQLLNQTVSEDTNPIWGDEWLKEVFKIPKGEVSQIITLEKSGTGLYFIVKVTDKGGGNYFSVEDLIKELKNKSQIKIYTN